MNIHGLQVSSKTIGAFTSTPIAKKEEAKFDLAIACFVLVF